MLTSGDEGLRIDTVEVPNVSGIIGLCACPGGRRLYTPDYNPHRDMDDDLHSLKQWGAQGVVSLLEHQEFLALRVTQLPERIEAEGMWWRHLPIRDMHAPTPEFERRWQRDGEFLRNALTGGEKVALHCFAGLGRTGTVAARLLIEFGIPPAAAIVRVRDARPGAIQTDEQEQYVEQCTPLDDDAGG